MHDLQTLQNFLGRFAQLVAHRPRQRDFKKDQEPLHLTVFNFMLYE